MTREKKPSRDVFLHGRAVVDGKPRGTLKGKLRKDGVGRGGSLSGKKRIGSSRVPEKARETLELPSQISGSPSRDTAILLTWGQQYKKSGESATTTIGSSDRKKRGTKRREGRGENGSASRRAGPSCLIFSVKN